MIIGLKHPSTPRSTSNKMFTSRLFLVLFGVAAFSRPAGSAPVNAEVCDGLHASTANITSIDVANVVLGENMRITYLLTTRHELRAPELLFDMSNSGIRIPCNERTAFGSCLYSFCGRRRFAVEQHMCAAWQCRCPIPPGTYVVRDILFPIPNFAGFIGGIITKANTNVSIRLKDEPANLSCARFSVRARSNKPTRAKQFEALGRNVLTCRDEAVTASTNTTTETEAPVNEILLLN